MIKELWSSFPKTLEERINSLLDDVEPRPLKAFQLYKTCQRENLWNESFEKFSEHLNRFFALPRNDRQKSVVDRFLERPLSTDVFEYFKVDFRTALVSSHALLEIASWAHHLMRVSMKTECVVISQDVFTKTLQHITNPPAHEKAEDIKFEDFCAAWKKVVFTLFGKKYNAELTHILNELQWLNQQNEKEQASAVERKSFPSIYLTQTEIDWTEAVAKAVRDNTSIPKFPLSRGPEKQRLIDLERTISLYRIVQTTRLPELLEQRDNIRVTLLDRCQRLLEDCAR